MFVTPLSDGPFRAVNWRREIWLCQLRTCEILRRLRQLTG
jgi:hypothetical protein